MTRRRRAPKDETVGVFLERWLTDDAAPFVRPSSLRTYRSAISNHIIPAIGEIQLADLHVRDVQGMLNDLTTQKGLGPHSVQLAKRVLHMALEFARKWGDVEGNAASFARAPAVGRRAFEPWTPEQARAFLGHVRNDRLYALYVVALGTGMRQGEILGLRWEDCDLAEATITPRFQLQDGALVDLKTEASGQTIAIPALVVRALSSHAVSHLREKQAAGEGWADALGLLFTEPDGDPLKARDLRDTFKGHISGAGVPPIRFHDLRWCLASFYGGSNVSPLVTQTLLRHSSLRMTEHYTRLRVEQQREAVRVIDGVLGGA